MLYDTHSFVYNSLQIVMKCNLEQVFEIEVKGIKK